jgi:hypothetical protein
MIYAHQDRSILKILLVTSETLLLISPFVM